MQQTAVNLNCPGCGSPIQTGIKYCEYCSRPIVIRSFTSIYDASNQELNKLALSAKKYASEHPDDKEISMLNFSAAICYLKLKLYDTACEAFEKAIVDNFDNSETYFYAAIALLKGKRPFLVHINDIKKILEFLNAAIMIDPKGIYHFFISYVKYDFFEKKFLKTSPSSMQELENAKIKNVSQEDIRMLFELLNQEPHYQI